MNPTNKPSQPHTYRPIQDYLQLGWSYQMTWFPNELDDPEKDSGYYFVEVLELPGCMSDGPTRETALENVQEALHLYLETLIEDGLPIPEPTSPKQFKGKIAYRTSPTKHYRMSLRARQRGISLNQLIDEAVDRQLEAG